MKADHLFAITSVPRMKLYRPLCVTLILTQIVLAGLFSPLVLFAQVYEGLTTSQIIQLKNADLSDDSIKYIDAEFRQGPSISIDEIVQMKSRGVSDETICSLVHSKRIQLERERQTERERQYREQQQKESEKVSTAQVVGDAISVVYILGAIAAMVFLFYLASAFKTDKK